MHDRDGAHAALVAQVRKVLGQLHRGEHALVGHGAAGQRREVDAGARRFDFRCERLGAFAQRVDAPVKVETARPAAVVLGRSDEQLRHVGHATQGRRTDFGAVGVNGDLAPAEHGQAFVGRDGFDALAGAGAGNRILWQEADTRGKGVGAVGRGRRELEADDLAQQFDGQLQQDARAVATIGFGARGPAVLEVFQSDEPVGDDGVRASALDVGDHGHATRIRFLFGVVQPLSFRQGREEHLHLRSPTCGGRAGVCARRAQIMAGRSLDDSCPGLHRPD